MHLLLAVPLNLSLPGITSASTSEASTANNGGVAPTEIVYFAGDGTSLSKAALAQVNKAVATFETRGGNGTIKVVGHSSSRTADMSVERHLEVVFQKSQARANAVAQALIKAGVPASQVQIEAVGDSQPIFYESMPMRLFQSSRKRMHLPTRSRTEIP